MNNLQLYLTIGLPMILVLVAWLSNRADINRLSDKLDRLNDKVDRLGDSLRAEMVLLRNDHHKDNMALMGYMVPLHERMTKLESTN